MPGSADEVVVESGDDVTIIHDGGDTQVGRLTLQESLKVIGGTITVDGEFSALPGELLTATGMGAILTIRGAATIDGTSFYVENGAAINLPSLTSYENTINGDCTLRASGDGSVLSLLNLTQITGRRHHRNDLSIEALAGGRVELPMATQVVSGAVQFQADGGGSVVDLSSLSSFQGYFDRTSSGFVATDGGTIQSGQLTSIREADLTLDGTGVMDTDQLRTFTGGGTLSVLEGNYGFQSLSTVGSLTISVEDNAGMSIGPGTESWFQQGIFLGSGGVLTTVGSPVFDVENFIVHGSLEVNAGSSPSFQSDVVFENLGRLYVSPTGNPEFKANLSGGTTNSDLFRPEGTVRFSGDGDADLPQFLEVMGEDLGPNDAGFTNNFAIGTVAVAADNHVRLVDESRNTSTSDTEALYVNSLVVPDGATLDLNGVQVYARGAAIAGTIVGNSWQEIPDSGPIEFAGAVKIPGRFFAAKEERWRACSRSRFEQLEAFKQG